MGKTDSSVLPASRETEPAAAAEATPVGERRATGQPGVKVALLTGGSDRSYAFGFTMALASRGVGVEVIGGAAVDSPEMHSTPAVRFLNLYGDSQHASFARRVLTILSFYARLIGYALTAKPQVFHILWNNKLQFIDRTLLMLFYKLLGKEITLTAHNVNAGRRDATNSFWNWLTLRIQYHLADHIFVHTREMQAQLQAEFGVPAQRVTVIPFGINVAVPHTCLTPAQARRRLGIAPDEKTILFFGAIKPYKGLDYLVTAFEELSRAGGNYRLVIAGELKKGMEEHSSQLQRAIRDRLRPEQVICKFEFVPDADTELYFKAADVTVLPYRDIFQSGVLVLAYSFGLPVIVTDVGSFREQVIEGRTGLVCKPGDPADLARAINRYFESDLFRDLDVRRPEIQSIARARYSWDRAAELTCDVYGSLLSKS